MTRTQKAFLTISLAFNVAFVAAFGFAYLGWASSPRAGSQSSQATGGRGAWWARDGLGLNQTQQRAFRQSDAELLKQIDGIEQQIAGYRSRLVELIAGGTASRGEIEAILGQISELQRNAQDLVVNSLVSKLALLDTAQKQRFVGDLHERMRCDWQQRGWRGQGRGGPGAGGRSRQGCDCGWCDQ